MRGGRSSAEKRFSQNRRIGSVPDVSISPPLGGTQILLVAQANQRSASVKVHYAILVKFVHQAIDLRDNESCCGAANNDAYQVLQA